MENSYKGRDWDAQGSPSGWSAEGRSVLGPGARRAADATAPGGPRTRASAELASWLGAAGSPPAQAPASPRPQTLPLETTGPGHLRVLPALTVHCSPLASGSHKRSWNTGPYHPRPPDQLWVWPSMVPRGVCPCGRPHVLLPSYRQSWCTAHTHSH